MKALLTITVLALSGLAFAGEPPAYVSAVVTESVSVPKFHYEQVCDGNTCRMVKVFDTDEGRSMVSASATTAASCPCVAATGSCLCAGGGAKAFTRVRSAIDNFRANRPILFPKLHAWLSR